MKRTVMVLALGVFWAADGTSRATPADPARPAAGTPVGVEGEKVIRAPFTIRDIDRPQRWVVVESPDGTRSTVTVSPETKGFDAVQIGDQVQIDYYRASVLKLAQADAPGHPAEEQPESLRRMRAGAAALRRHEITTEAKVVSIDPAGRTLQVATVDGRPQTMYVKSAALRKALGTLQAGDAVTVTYIEPMAVGLHRLDESGALRQPPS